jgi:hypothetical protein
MDFAQVECAHFEKVLADLDTGVAGVQLSESVRTLV